MTKSELDDERSSHGGRSPSMRSWGVIAFVSIVGVVLLYALKVLDDLSAIRERNLLELEGAARNVDALLRNAPTTVANLLKGGEFLCDFERRQPYLSLQPGKSCHDKPVRNGETKFSFRHRDGDLELVAKDVTFGGDEELVFRVDLERVLDDVPVSTAFTRILIVDRDGDVLFNRKASAVEDAALGLRIANLNAVLEQIKTKGTARRWSISPEVPTFDELLGASRSFAYDAAGSRHEVFCQPLARDDPSVELAAGTPSLLCALTTQRRFLWAALDVEPVLAILLLLVLAGGLLLWPALKLLAAHRLERFDSSDALFLLLSTGAASILASVLLLDMGGYLRLRSVAVAQLEELADTVNTSFVDEISALKRQLEDYNLEFDGSLDDICDPANAPTCTQENLLQAAKAGSAGQVCPVLPPPSYRFFRSVFWMNENGQQCLKATIEKTNTPFVDLAHRRYFRAIRDGDAWDLESRVEGSAAHFFVEAFLSITTAERYAALTVPVPKSKVVAGISLQPSFVTFPVLPSGTGFAIISGDNSIGAPRLGTVLFHSDRRRALNEVLFDAIGEGRRLESIMVSNGEGTFRTRYGTRIHLMHVRPFKGVDFGGEPLWWIVTFRHTELVETVALEALLDALVVGLAYFGVFALVAVVWMSFRPTASWLWPNEELKGSYRRLIVELTLLLVIVSSLMPLLPGRWPLLVGCLAPILSIAWVAVRFCRPELFSWEPPVDARSARNVYIVATLALWLLLGVVPGASFFFAAWNQQIAQLVRVEQLDAVAALASRDRAIRDDYERIVVDEKEEFLADSFERGAKAYLSHGIFDTTFEPSGSREEPAPAAVYRPLYDSPLYNPSVGRLRYAPTDATADEGWRWLVSDDETLLEPAPWNAHGYRLRSVMRNLDPPPWWIAVLLVVGIPLFAWVRYSARNLLFGAVQEIRDGVESLRALLQTGRGLLVISPSIVRREQLASELQKEKAEAGTFVQELNLDLVGSAEGTALLEELRERLKDQKLVLLAPSNPLERPNSLGEGRDGGSGVRLTEWHSLFAKLRVVYLRPSASTPSAAEHESDEQDYWAVWRSLSVDERLVVVHIALERIVNPKQKGIVEGLLRKGIVVRRPGLRLYSDGFEKFVDRVQDGDEIARIEVSGAALGWAGMRWIFIVLLTTLAVFLFVAQREFFESALAMIGAVAVAVPSLVSVVRSVGERNGGTS